MSSAAIVWCMQYKLVCGARSRCHLVRTVGNLLLDAAKYAGLLDKPKNEGAPYVGESAVWNAFQPVNYPLSVNGPMPRCVFSARLYFVLVCFLRCVLISLYGTLSNMNIHYYMNKQQAHESNLYAVPISDGWVPL